MYRGLYPENSLPACIHALELGVDGLEFDLVCNKAGEVILSHEPWFNHEISLNPLGKRIPKSKEQSYDLYHMSYKDIQTYDVGSKAHPKFTSQVKLKTYKPILREVFSEIKIWCAKKGKPVPEFYVEIKRKPEWDNEFLPPLPAYVDYILRDLNTLGKNDLIHIMSLDIELLNHIHLKAPQYKLVMLSENRKSIQRDIDELGFTPWAYAPTFKKIKAETQKWATEKDIKLIPWTVNEEEDIGNMLQLGVFGIISDFPDRVMERRSSLNE